MSSSLHHPWTQARQDRAAGVLASLDALECTPDRVLAWNGSTRPDDEGHCVVHWMARAQRGSHNLALDCSVAAARSLDLPLVLVFRLVAGPTNTQVRHVDFLLRGLRDAFAEARLRGAQVLLVDRDGPALEHLLGPDLLRPVLVVTDEDVMPRARAWRLRVARSLRAPVVSVDVDAVVPGACFPRQEYAARTLRPKLHRILAQFDHELGMDGAGPPAPVTPVPAGALALPGVRLVDDALLEPAAWARVVEAQLTAAAGQGVSWIAPALPDEPSGSVAARARLHTFVTRELAGYATARNKPELDSTSRISAYSHFGQLSPHEVLRAVRDAGAPAADTAAFVEEFVVRRELAQNFVRWNPDAATLAGAPDWARATLATHASDPREWTWDDDTLEAGETHDPLWNAAQLQLVARGHMHGYLRMYWAKKLLEWRADPADAFDIALRLNDRWQLDGRDPNGITGVAWAIGGVHDRPWGERPVFGMIRYMSLASTGRKFDSRTFVERWGGLRGAALRDPGRYAPRGDTPPLF